MKRIHASAAPLRAALSALLLGACALQVPPALAQTPNPPEQMTYQGFLVGSDGVALGNTAPKNYDVIFRIYNHETASAGGNLLWAEQQTVTVDKGYFSVLLGEGASTGDPRPALSTLFKGATASDRFVGITVKGIGGGGANVDILPRLRLMTSPYAFLAQNAVKLVQNNAAGTDLITSSGNVLSIGGHLDVLGNNSLEFGADVAGKQGDAGRLGYNLFNNGGNLDIVGAGTSASNRKIKLWAEGGLTITGPVTATSFAGTHTGDGSGLTGVAKLGDNIFTGYQEVQNHLRVGELASSGSTAGWGKALIFSGAPPLSFGNADNSDPLWMARYNAAANSSELRMVIGDDPGSSADRFVIGTMAGFGNFSQSATWNPLYAFRANGMLEFKPGIAKEVSAGTIGYQVHSSDSLDIVGAGTTGFNRKVQIWAEGGLQLNGSLNGSSGMTINTGNGKTAVVEASWISIYHASNKAKRVDIDRVDNGVRIWANGGGFGNASGDIRSIVWDGDGNWDVGSDRKLKKDIVDAEPVLERALQVQVRRFRWKDAPADSKLSLGVIAQELQPLFPDMIGEDENKETHEKNLTVGYSDFGVIAIKAIQELKTLQDAEIKDLKAEVADLKAQMKEVLAAAAELRGQVDKSKVTAAAAK